MVVVKSMVHSPVTWSSGPFIIVWPPRSMCQWLCSKMALQLLSQNFAMESKFFPCMSGKMWACLAFRGSCGKLSMPVCVDVMLLPLGMVAVMTFWAGCFSATGVLGSRKWSVQPVLAIAIDVGVVWSGGV